MKRYIRDIKELMWDRNHLHWQSLNASARRNFFNVLSKQVSFIVQESIILTISDMNFFQLLSLHLLLFHLFHGMLVIVMVVVMVML